MLRIYRFLLTLAIGVVAYSCQSTASDAPLRMQDQFNTVVVEAETIVTGQTVYVPVYSHVYQRNVNNPVMQLSATLSVRNTDLENSLILTTVRYYDSQGELVRNALEMPIEIPPLASADYLVESEDTSGGIGANFIVEWVAETEITEPVIESLMIATTGNQGISFISPGRVIQQQGTQVAAPSGSP
jgi:hypothetical protein